MIHIFYKTVCCASRALSTFLDVKYRPDLKRSGRYERKEIFLSPDIDRYRPQKNLGVLPCRRTHYLSYPPIFPGIIDVKTSIAREGNTAVSFSWRNLRDAYKTVILDCIQKKYPKSFALVLGETFSKDSRSHWKHLNAELRDCTARIRLEDVPNDDNMQWPFVAPPILVNYFYHKQIQSPLGKKRQARLEQLEVEVD